MTMATTTRDSFWDVSAMLYGVAEQPDIKELFRQWLQAQMADPQQGILMGIRDELGDIKERLERLEGDKVRALEARAKRVDDIAWKIIALALIFLLGAGVVATIKNGGHP